MLDLRGRVVGIHSRIGERITSNFHVPIGAYHRNWDRLLAGDMWGGPLDVHEPEEARPILGIAGHSRSDRCQVTQVFPNMPAAAAGIQVGDVVRKFNEQPVRTFGQLSLMVMGQRPGDVVSLEIQRGAETLTFDVMLGHTGRVLPGGPESVPDEAEQPG